MLDRLKAVARGSLARAAASDRLWLVLADGVARAGTPDALVATVDSAGVSARRLDLTAAVRAAARLVDAEPLPAREVHVVSDLQRTALGPGRAGVPRGVRVLALAPPSQAPANRGVGAVRITDGAATVGIVGTPGEGGDAAPVTLRIRGREVGRALAAPGSTATITLPPLGAGWWVGEAVLDADELRADDRRLLVWRVAPPARVAAPGSTGGGPFVAAALAVLEEGQRVRPGNEVAIGDRPEAGTLVSIVIPPPEPALIGQANRALAARGGRWRFASEGTPGPIAGPAVPAIAGLQVARRYRIEPLAGGGGGGGGPGTGSDSSVLATVNGEPWLVRDGSILLLGSRLDTAWTSLPAAPAFVPFVDALVNRLARGEAPITEVEGSPGVEFRTRGADTIGAIVSGLDPRESDLTPASPALVRDVLGGEVLDEAAFAAARFAGAGRRDGSGLLLMLALLIALAELGVATRTR